MAPPILVTTLLSLKGEIRRAQVKLNDDGTLDIGLLQAYFRKKSEPSVIGKLHHGENKLFIMGYTEGKSGTENKYVLPAPYEKTIIYGDALIIAATDTWTTPVTYLPLTWESYLKSVTASSAATVTKKSAAADDVEEDPVSEDEELARHEDEEEEEPEPEDEDAASEPEIDLEEEEEEPVPVPKKKKKTANAATLSGYQRQNILLMSESKNELQPSSTIDSPLRKDCYQRFKFLDLGQDQEAIIQELEQEIYGAALEEAKKKHIFAHWDNKLFEEIYIQRQRRLFSNLHPSSPVKNIHLLERVKRQELTMAELARLSDIELFPTNWTVLQEQQQIREHKWLEGNTSMKSDKFVCSRCHKRECSYYELQTRSADEPMTVFITCLNCNKKWRN